MKRKLLSMRTRRLRRRKRYRLIRELALFAAAAAALFAASWFFASHPATTITRLRVAGADSASSSLIESVARAQLEGAYLAVFPRSNRFLYPKRDIAAALHEAFPGLQSVAIRGEGLSGLAISVTERKRAALLCGQAGDVRESGSEEPPCFFMDESGFIFAEAPRSFDVSLPLFRLPRGGAGRVELGGRYGDGILLARLILLTEAMKQLKLDVAETVRLANGELMIVLRGGSRLLLREDQRFEETVALLRDVLREEGLLSHDGTARFEYVDLRFGNKVYYKPG